MFKKLTGSNYPKAARFRSALLFSLAQTCVLSFACRGLQAHAKAGLAIEDRIPLLNRALLVELRGEHASSVCFYVSLARTCVLSFACRNLQAHAKAGLAIEDRIPLLNRALVGGASRRARFIRVLLFSLAQTYVLSFACRSLQAHAKAGLAIEDRIPLLNRALVGEAFGGESIRGSLEIW